MTPANVLMTYTTFPLWAKLKTKAKQFRSRPTIAEATLWEILKNRRLGGYKFRRQHPIDRFLVDFCCPQMKLVVEVDGGIHKSKETEDSTRQEKLEEIDYKVLRFSNEAVENNLNQVLSKILNTLNE